MIQDTKLGDTHAPWQKEFFKNIQGFKEYGVPEDKAKELLFKFIKLSSEVPLPDVMKTFEDPSKLEEVGVYTQQNPKIRDFVVEFLKPLLQNFTFEGKENLQYILPLTEKFPVTLISNHLSHLDAPAIYLMLYKEGGIAREIADRLVFIAGRLAFTEDFARLGLYMFDTLLVCSKKDMSQNPSLADVMTRINMRAFRQSQQLQKQGKIIAIFPEGTRSRTGQLMSFVDAVYHYVINRIVIPVSIEGSDEILPTSTFLFNAAKGRFVLGKPVLVGRLSQNLMKEIPEYVDRLEIPEHVPDKKQYVIDSLAYLVGKNLHKHRHGFYRNLYKALDQNENILIPIPKEPKEKVIIIGHSPYSAAMGCILANKDTTIKIFILDEEKKQSFNLSNLDQDHYPFFKLPPNIEYTTDPREIQKATLIIQSVRPWELEKYYSLLQESILSTSVPIINVAKGFTNSKTGLITDELIFRYNIDPNRIFVLSGANYPQQVMERKITGYEIAAYSQVDKIDYFVQLFSNMYIYVRPAIVKNDIRGVQLGSALKNIYALATGLIDGYFSKFYGGNSDNTLFHLSNRFFREMVAIGKELGGQEETFHGLSGLSDLMLACFGKDSKDRQWGYDFVFGNADPNRMSSGIFGISILPKLINLEFEKFPIATAVYKVIIEKVPLEQIFDSLAIKLKKF
ncbi:MAG: 1-acyl-sn-glycerol-3-phosphate acyltransferase [Leptonema sp. (in: bacteria)]